MSRIPANTTAERWEELINEDRIDEVVGYCVFCGKEVNGLNWCFGCEAFICEECDVTGVGGFDHIPQDHRG